MNDDRSYDRINNKQYIWNMDIMQQFIPRSVKCTPFTFSSQNECVLYSMIRQSMSL